MNKKLWVIAAMATALTACSNNDEIENERVEAQVTAGVGVTTRMSGTTWEADDVIGVYVTGVTGTTEGFISKMESIYRNAKYVLSRGANSGNATFTAEESDKIYFQDSNETVTFSAYYPYQNIPWNISIDTKNYNTAGGQKKIDFLHATGATASKSSPAISFTGDHEFHHVMSRLMLNIKCSTVDGFESTSLPADARVTLSGLVHEGTLDFHFNNIGVPQLKAGAAAVADWDVTSSFGSLILLPQDLSAAPLTIAITVNGQTYKNSTSICPRMEPGTAYSYNITLRKTGMTISGCTISDWRQSNGGDGDATLR